MKYLALGIALLFLPVAAHAAEFAITSHDTVGVGDEFSVEVLLSSPGESINAIEGALELSPNLALQSIEDGSSIVLFWTDRPHAVQSRVIFSGIMPGGYSAVGGSVVRLRVRAEAAGPAYVRGAEVYAYLHDGEGTPAPLTLVPFEFTVLPESVGQAGLNTPDTTPPEPFTFAVSRDPNLFNGAWFVVFATQDKGNGISRYEVCEGDICTESESPYLLKDQKLDARIMVKAYDRSGNVRTATEESGIPWWVYAGAGSALLVLVCMYIWRRRS